MNRIPWAVVAALLIGAAAGRLTAAGDPNSAPTYGDTGLPKNCRAFIQSSLDSWALKQYPADQIFSSISRNCGANGYSWGR
ncbi:hypothetical protein QE391_003137 [Pseudomonas fluorescens]|nr:hypothetical protein [Pseudomonas fluorescens]